MGLSPDAIKQRWEENRIRSANQGTWMHFQFELWLNRCPVEGHSQEMMLFLKYIKSLSGFRALRTEWAIFGETENLAGSIDCVLEDSHDNLVIIDWKRSKQLRHKYANPYQQMNYPLSHLDDCAGEHYRLQLNCYRYLLEKYYNRKVCFNASGVHASRQWM